VFDKHNLERKRVLSEKQETSFSPLLTQKIGGKKTMARECAVCLKRRASGNNVSHSNRKTRRSFGVNLKKVNVELDGVEKKEYLCTRCMRTANKD